MSLPSLKFLASLTNAQLAQVLSALTKEQLALVASAPLELDE